MALAWYVDGPGGVGPAFAAHDEFLSLLSYFLRPDEPQGRGSGSGSEADAGRSRSPLTPDDEFYAAPFCFLPKSRKGGFLVFVPQVPWLSSNFSDDGGSPHAKARDWMDRRGKGAVPHVGTVEHFQKATGVKERDLFTFTPNGYYPSKEDVSRALVVKTAAFNSTRWGTFETIRPHPLIFAPPQMDATTTEDTSVRVTCEAMGWDVPRDWRTVREKQRKLHGMPLLDLAEWDRRKRKHESDGDDEAADDERAPSCETSERRVDLQEEKKDSVEERHRC
ncbi:LOW QUALITY PROTEIN: hypothetical protein ACHAWF_012416 [Thalassiosira exigua]